MLSSIFVEIEAFDGGGVRARGRRALSSLRTATDRCALAGRLRRSNFRSSPAP